MHVDDIVAAITLDHVPAAQLTHADADDAAITLDHVPALQFVHEPSPAEDHVPAAHATHVTGRVDPEM